MRVLVIYKEQSEHRREVEDYMRDFKMRTDKTIETMNPESRAGADFCRTYDVVEYPTMLALSDDGHIQNTWRGTPLPTIDEVSYYA